MLKSFHHRLDILLITSFDAYSLAKPFNILDPIGKVIKTRGKVQEARLTPIPLISSRRHEENHHCAIQNPMSNN